MSIKPDYDQFIHQDAQRYVVAIHNVRAGVYRVPVTPTRFVSIKALTDAPVTFADHDSAYRRAKYVFGETWRSLNSL